MKQYHNQIDTYALRRHNQALELGFIYLEKDLYLLPLSWFNPTSKIDIKIDLSACGESTNQILKTISIQLLKIITEGISAETLFAEQL